MAWPLQRKSDIIIFEALCDDCQVGLPDLFLTHEGAVLALAEHYRQIQRSPIHSPSARLSIVRLKIPIYEVGEE